VIGWSSGGEVLMWWCLDVSPPMCGRCRDCWPSSFGGDEVLVATATTLVVACCPDFGFSGGGF
jgi:hypothetical protein